MEKLIWFALVLFIASCGPVSGTFEPIEARTLTVFAAASLTDAFREIGDGFETTHAGLTIIFNFAGSQALRTQIEEGAQADVFAPANAKEMETLVSGGFIDSARPKIFLTNQLALILPADNPAGIQSLEDLSEPDLKLVLAAEDVPAGNYSRQSLRLMDMVYGADFKDRVLANVVSNEDNVRQVLAKVQLGEADAGIVYKSDAASVPELKQVEIPAEVNVIAAYPIAPLSASPNMALATEFIDYVFSVEGQAVLKKWGFLPPQ